MQHRSKFGQLLAMLAVVTVVAVACGGSAAPTASATPTATPASAPLTGKISVFAASSLTEVFKTVAADFQKANPGVTVEFNFAASSALATQIDQAAPADIFASADTANMTKVTDKSQIDGTPVTFARNLPVIVVPASNKAGIAGPKDLSKAGVKLVLAAPDVPIGNYARQIIDRLSAMPEYGAPYKDATLKNLVSNEQNVRAVLAKIELGEADAGIVYKTDALVSKEKVKTIAIPDAANVIATYPIGVLKTTKNKNAAVAFIEFVTGPQGETALKAAGFDSAS
ncbi:MAG: molybdate ABC transporter substrate-binding protein [Chloroflexota bacterium]